MKEASFEELLASVREGGAILRGERKASRRTKVAPPINAAQIRQRTRLSQADFASLMGVSVKTLQNWEQLRRSPAGPAAALLRIISHDPHLALKAIHS